MHVFKYFPEILLNILKLCWEQPLDTTPEEGIGRGRRDKVLKGNWYWPNILGRSPNLIKLIKYRCYANEMEMNWIVMMLAKLQV